MKIVYCLAGLFNSGGMERIVISKANSLARMGYDITIVTTEQKGRAIFFSLYETVKVVDLNINYSNDAAKNLILKGICFWWRKLMHRKRLTGFLISSSPDITISTFGTESSFLYKIPDKSKKVLEIHFSKYFRYQYDRKGLWRFVDIFRSRQDAQLIPHYDKFVVLTNEDKSYWGNLSNIEVIPNFVASIPEIKSELRSKVCMAVGRLSYQKGFDRLIKVWKVVHRRYPDWQLQIYGSGELYDVLYDMIVEDDLEECVHINPPTPQIGMVYQKASVFLLTSHYEGLPMVLLEAFSYGLPVVSFACKCGPRDLIKNGVNGFLIPEGDVVSFADKVSIILGDEKLREQLGNAAYQSAMEYTEEKIMSKWIHLFESLK